MSQHKQRLRPWDRKKTNDNSCRSHLTGPCRKSMWDIKNQPERCLHPPFPHGKPGEANLKTTDEDRRDARSENARNAGRKGHVPGV